MELICRQCGRSVGVPEPFSTLHLHDAAVVVDGLVFHDCRRRVLEEAAILVRDSVRLCAKAEQARSESEALVAR